MGKFNKEGIKSDKGFTMIELIIVIAILGILAAILVPSFTSMTRKSRLKADITTVKQLQTQYDLYVADNDGTEPGATVATAITTLVDEGYIKEVDTITKTEIAYQTTGAKTDKVNDHYVVDLTGLDAKITGLKVTAKELEWLKGSTYKP